MDSGEGDEVLSPDLGELAEILDDVSVEMIPLRYG